MKNKIILALIITTISTPAIAYTEPYPGSIRFTGDVSCPAAYPVKTGESGGPGGYTTTCYTTQAWSLYLEGGDAWTSWLAGTWTPAPIPTPTITITATPEPIIQTVERVVNTTSIQTVIEPCVPKQLTTKEQIKKEIKKLQKALRKLNAKNTSR